MVVGLLWFRLFLSDKPQNWKAVLVLLRWDGRDHRLPCNVCSVDLRDCSDKDLNGVDAFPGLACTWGARHHLESVFHDY